MIISKMNVSSQTQRVWDASNRYGCEQMKQCAVAESEQTDGLRVYGEGATARAGARANEQNTNCLQFVNSGLFMQLTNIIRKRR